MRTNSLLASLTVFALLTSLVYSATVAVSAPAAQAADTFVATYSFSGELRGSGDVDSFPIRPLKPSERVVVTGRFIATGNPANARLAIAANIGLPVSETVSATNAGYTDVTVNDSGHLNAAFTPQSIQVSRISRDSNYIITVTVLDRTDADAGLFFNEAGTDHLTVRGVCSGDTVVGNLAEPVDIGGGLELEDDHFYAFQVPGNSTLLMGGYLASVRTTSLFYVDRVDPVTGTVVESVYSTSAGIAPAQSKSFSWENTTSTEQLIVLRLSVTNQDLASYEFLVDTGEAASECDFPDVPNITVRAMEINQVVQNWNNSMPLVTEKKTVIRIFVEYDQPTSQLPYEVGGSIAIKRDGVNVGRVFPTRALQGSLVTGDASVLDVREKLTNSLNFEIDPGMLTFAGDYTFHFQPYLRAAGRKYPVDCDNKCEETAVFQRVPNVKLFAVRGSVNGSPVLSTPEFAELLHRAADTQPIADFRRATTVVDQWAAKMWNFNGDAEEIRASMREQFEKSVFLFRDEFEGYSAVMLLQAGDSPTDLSVGAHISENAGRADLIYAFSGTQVGITSPDRWGRPGSTTGTPARNVIGHELGHAVGTDHAAASLPNCEEDNYGSGWDELIRPGWGIPVGDPDRAPITVMGDLDPDGGNDAYFNTEPWGLSTRLVGVLDIGAVVNPHETVDLMSYCSDRTPGDVLNFQGYWPGRITYPQLLAGWLDVEVDPGDDAALANMTSTSTRFWGAIDATPATSILRAEESPLPVDPASSGSYTLALSDAAGAVVQSIPFDPIIDPAAYGSAPSLPYFNLHVDVLPGVVSAEVIHAGAATVTLDQTASAPQLSQLSAQVVGDTVQVSWTQSDADSPQLWSEVAISYDGGATFRPVTLAETDTSVSYNLVDLAGGSAVFQVTVRDEWNETIAVTAAVTLPDNLPYLEMASPLDYEVLDQFATTVFSAAALDQEDGDLHSTVTWTVDGQPLGMGTDLNIDGGDLGVGQHTIVASVTDSAGQTVTISREVIVIGNAGLAADLCLTAMPTIVGSAASEFIAGTSGPDVIWGMGGDDTIVGMGGDDVICGGDGNDTLNGGAGNDFISGDADNDAIYGLDGNDTLFAGSGADTVIGGPGNDAIDGSSGDDTLNGGPGMDELVGGDGNDALYGQSGDDILLGGPGDDTLLGSDGFDVLEGDGGADLMNGGPDDDDLSGGDGPDTLFGLTGNDTVLGGPGNDALYGQLGDDIVDGDEGDDFLWGNEGEDILLAPTGTNTFNGGPDDDTITGGDGIDTIYGDGNLAQAGNDTLEGGPGVDLILGFAGDDILIADDGEADTVNGGPGVDTCVTDNTDTVYFCP